MRVLEISQAVEYGVRGLMHLVQSQSGRPVRVKEIAQSEEIPPAFLYKIFSRMRRHRILNSRRGIGYTLASPPEQITLLDVIQAIEGPIMVKPCLVDENYCERVSQCVLVAFWTSIQEGVVDKLRTVSILDLASPGRPLADSMPTFVEDGATQPR